MGIFAGFDISAYPGNENMALLRAKTNLKSVVFYIGPTPSHPETDWMDTRAELVAQGWGLAPVFVGRQVVGPGARLGPGPGPAVEGTEDGKLTADLMSKAGFQTGSWVYLDLENGPPFTPELRSYVQTWAAAVRQRQFCPGVYCSHTFADQVSQAVPGARIYAVKVQTVEPHDGSHYGSNFPLFDPHASGFQFAYGWQHEQNVTIAVDGLFLDVDLDVWVTPDPSR